MRDVVAVGNSEHHVHPSDPLCRNVLDHIPPDLAVRHHQRLVVDGQYGGADQAHAADSSKGSRRLDQIPHIIGTVNEDHHPGGEIGKGVLQGEADDEADHSEPRQEGGDLEAEL